MRRQTNSGSNSQPGLDASLGLIYRLNILFYECDKEAQRGEFDSWNVVLDRIYCNLLYKNDISIVKDQEGKIISMKLTTDDEAEYIYLTSQIFKAKKQFFETPKVKSKLTSRDKIIAKSRWYRALMMKDVWLRKLMMKLKLYLKETEYSPGSALFG
jgi:hypothetical protein